MYNSHLRFFAVGQAMLCRERQPLWKSDDGLNLTCLDQCHGVPSEAQAPHKADAKELTYSLPSQIDP